MKITMTMEDGTTRECTIPYDGCDYVVVEGKCPNPACTHPDSPFHVAGVKGTMVKGFNTFTSDAGCIGCKTVSGKLVVTVDTLFGIEEDERVLRGRCRVY